MALKSLKDQLRDPGDPSHRTVTSYRPSGDLRAFAAAHRQGLVAGATEWLIRYHYVAMYFPYS